jgi:hypothetical protein
MECVIGSTAKFVNISILVLSSDNEDGMKCVRIKDISVYDSFDQSADGEIGIDAK